MVNVTYSDLLDLISNGQLVPDSEYCVTDYPTFQPVLKARTESELWRDGYTSGGYKLLYDPFNDDGEYAWASSYGWVYYLEANGNSAWFDFINYGNIRNSNGVHIGPTFDSDGHRTVYSGAILQCSDVQVLGEGSVSLSASQHVILGSGNSGTVTGSEWLTVGDNNSDLAVEGALDTSIGDGNENVAVSHTEGVEIMHRNTSVTVSGSYNAVGSDNKTVELSGSNNEILNRCRNLNLSGDRNNIDSSSSVDISSECNTVTGSSAVALVESVGNNVEYSKLVYLDKVNNNDLWVDNYINSNSPYMLPDGETVRQYYPGEAEPFQRVTNTNGDKVRKVVVDRNPLNEYQTDNFGLVVNTVNDKTKGSSKSTDTYYIGKDGSWNAASVVTDEYDVTLIISKTQSQHCYVSGAGRYMDGQACTLGYTWLDDGWTCSFQDENGNIHAAPYTFIVSGNTKVVALVARTEPVQPNNEIWYTSTDEQVVTPNQPGGIQDADGNTLNILSNTYSDGKGVIKLDGDVASFAPVNSIGVFASCTTLASVSIPDSVTRIDDSTFQSCTSLTSIVIPDSVTIIGGSAFQSCSGLTSVTIGNSVTAIGLNAFYGCSGLVAIESLATTAPTIYSTTFRAVPENGTLTVPSGADYSVWMQTSNYYLGLYGWTLVQQ